MKRRGFALLAVLWVMTGLAVLALAAMLAAREAVAAARNRIAWTRAAWRAEGCAERVRATIDGALAAGGKWQDLAHESPLAILDATSCRATLMPSGYTVDVNPAGVERLTGLFRASGVSPVRVDSLVDAIVDWRDDDDSPSTLGAESAWYRERQMIAPRNGPLGDAAELRFVRGIAASGAANLLGTESGKTPVNLAPLPVVASLPGMSPEAIEALADRRRRNVPVTDLARLAYGISASARDTLLRRFAELAELATVDPEYWILDVSAAEGVPAVEAVVQLRLAPGPAGAIVVGKKIW